MRWKITIEGLDEFGGRGATEMVVEKDFGRLSKGEIGLTIADGKSIMACLQGHTARSRQAETGVRFPRTFDVVPPRAIRN